MLREGVWGTICDDNWDIKDANVVCRQAGFGTAFEAVRNSAFGSGVGRVGSILAVKTRYSFFSLPPELAVPFKMACTTAWQCLGRRLTCSFG